MLLTTSVATELLAAAQKCHRGIQYLGLLHSDTAVHAGGEFDLFLKSPRLTPFPTSPRLQPGGTESSRAL